MSKNPRMTGAAGELLVMQDLYRNSCEVYRDFSGTGRIDIIALYNGVLKKVQIKTVSDSSSGSISALAANSRGGKWMRYSPEECDVLAVAVLDRNQVLYIPFHQFNGQRGISINWDRPVYERKITRYASEFTFEKSF